MGTRNFEQEVWWTLEQGKNRIPDIVLSEVADISTVCLQTRTTFTILLYTQTLQCTPD
jgi:hypothetical protein